MGAVCLPWRGHLLLNNGQMGQCVWAKVMSFWPMAAEVLYRSGTWTLEGVHRRMGLKNCLLS